VIEKAPQLARGSGAHDPEMSRPDSRGIAKGKSATGFSSVSPAQQHTSARYDMSNDECLVGGDSVSSAMRAGACSPVQPFKPPSIRS
jgi:hypothetical protein